MPMIKIKATAPAAIATIRIRNPVLLLLPPLLPFVDVDEVESLSLVRLPDPLAEARRTLAGRSAAGAVGCVPI